MFDVVAVDEEWVIIWDRGYQAWNMYGASQGIADTFGCADTTLDSYLETHPAGFYKIQRNKVWLDFGLAENYPYSSEAKIPKEGNGVITKLAYLRPVPDEAEKIYTPVYALPMGTKINVFSTEPVPSKAPGSTVKYYKVSFSGNEKVQNNMVGYLQYTVPGVFYLDSRYLNVTRTGTKTPAGAMVGKIVNIAPNGSVYVYPSKDTGSEPVGILALDGEIGMLPSESDASWTTVYFSGQKAYVEAKYIKQTSKKFQDNKETYQVTDISNLRIADIVKDEIQMKWNAGKIMRSILAAVT